MDSPENNISLILLKKTTMLTYRVAHQSSIRETDQDIRHSKHNAMFDQASMLMKSKKLGQHLKKLTKMDLEELILKNLNMH